MRFFKDESCKDLPIDQIGYDDEDQTYTIWARTPKDAKDIGAICHTVCETATDSGKDIKYQSLPLPDNQIQIIGEDAGTLVQMFTQSEPRYMSEILAAKVTEFLQGQKKTIESKLVIAEGRKASNDGVDSDKKILFHHNALSLL